MIFQMISDKIFGKIFHQFFCMINAIHGEIFRETFILVRFLKIAKKFFEISLCVY